MQNNIFILALVLVISGCAGMGTIPTVVEHTTTVEVPVAIACKTPEPPPPIYCFDTLKESDDLYTKTRCLLSDRKKSIAYEINLLVSFNSCK